MSEVEVHSDKITVAHVTSGYGDHELCVYEGWLTRGEVAQRVFEKAADWWVSPDMVLVRNCTWITVLP